MEDQFFDVCVQTTILKKCCAYDKEEQLACQKTLDFILNEEAFKKWTSDIHLEEVEQIANIFIKTYGQDIVGEVNIKLPKAMKKLVKNFDLLYTINELEKKKLQHEATQEVFKNIEASFQLLMEAQKENIFKLEWKKLIKE